MERGKWTAILLTSATIPGVSAAEIRDHLAALHVPTEISPDAGAVGGTAIYQVAALGFVTLDSRAPIDVRQGRYAYIDPYRGGSITTDR